MRYNITLFILTLLFCNTAFSQTGPGGVGNSTSNILWLRADDISGLASGDTVFNWLDTSGNTNHVSQPDGDFTPEYQAGVVNGFPIVRFNKTNGRLRKTGFTDFPTTAITEIFVNRNNGEAGDGILSYASSSSNNDFLLFRSNNINVYRGSNIQASGVSINDNDWHITNASWSNTVGNVQVWKDGDQQHNSNGLNTGGAITAGGSLAIAGEQDIVDGNYAANQAHFGDFTEIIIYNYDLNEAENIIVANYLSAKYGQSLDSNDVYNADDNANDDYDFDVAGIGQAADGSNNTDAIGRGVVGMSNAAGLDNNEFLLWGHDAGVLEATETSDVPGIVEARLDRVWRASEADTSGNSVDVGAVDIRFDLTDLGSVTPSELRLLVDTDNDGIFSDETPISGATSLGGNVYQFAGVTAITDSTRFTLGTIDVSSTPIPVELTYFTANLLETGSVKLDWETASENNNSHFTIERSFNGLDWTELVKLASKGNSSSIAHYTAYDKNPITGNNYYRLKQTDYDEIYSYYQTKRITVKESEKSSIFPNPTQGLITITGNMEELKQINIYNVLGENVSIDTQQIIVNNSEVSIDLSKLESGMYYIKTSTKAHKVYKN